MIICFDFNNKKILFIKQQNTKSHFAVDFLINENAIQLDEVMEQVLANNQNILLLLKHDKDNAIVLPDSIVGYDMFTVPTVRFGKNQYFDTKFNTLYNKSDILNVCTQVLLKDKEQTVNNFYYVKKDIIEKLTLLFKKYGVSLNRISFYSQSVVDYVLNSSKQLSKCGFIVAQSTKDSINLIAVNNSIVIGFGQINKNSDSSVTKKYANSLKLRRRIVKTEDAEEIKQLSKFKNETSDKDMFLMYLQDFKDSFANQDININFDNICLIDFNDKNYKIEKDLKFEKVLSLKNISEQELLSRSRTNIFAVKKRGFWLWKAKKD